MRLTPIGIAAALVLYGSFAYAQVRALRGAHDR